jgi:hypothetical protein
MPTPRTHDFEEVATLHDEEAGLVGVISRRRGPHGLYSFALMKQYKVKGETKRSAFMNKHHVAAAHRLLDQVDAELDRLEAAK